MTGGSPKLARRGLRRIVAAAFIVGSVGLARWLGDTVAVTASSALLWAGGALAGVLWLAGMTACLASILRGEEGSGRARGGFMAGAIVLAAVVAYAGAGGFERIAIPPPVPPLEIPRASGDGADRPGGGDAADPADPGRSGDDVYVNEDYRYSIDGPGLPAALPREEYEGWDSGVRFRELGPGTVLWIDVLADDQGPEAGDDAGVERWFEDLPSRYEDSGITPYRLTRGMVNGRPSLTVLSRTKDLEYGDPVVIADTWIAGHGSTYLVHGFAYWEDWRQVRSRWREIVGTFECW